MFRSWLSQEMSCSLIMSAFPVAIVILMEATAGVNVEKRSRA